MMQGNFAGQSLAQYQLRELLGMGGMGSVYRGYQTNLKREVAVKIISPNLLTNTDAMSRFIREAEVSAQLEHPNIVPIYDFGTFNGITYVVMRLLTGESLSRRIEQRIQQRTDSKRPLMSLGEVAELLKQVGGALDYAHSRGVIHRDIKPANIMFDNQGKPYVVDFGIAKIATAGTAFTQTGMAMGTPNYMPPEQWRGENLTPAADQYALAVMTYQLLTGRMPFDGDSAFVLMHKHLNEMPTPLNIIRPDLPPSLMIVLTRALAKDPRQRFQSCSAFAHAFESAIEGNKGQATGMFVFPVSKMATGGTPISSRIPTTTGGYLPPNVTPSSNYLPTPHQKQTSQNPLIWAGGLVLLLMCVGLLVAILGNNPSDEDNLALSASSTANTVLILSTDTPIPTLTFTPTASSTPTHTPTATVTLSIQQAAIATRDYIATLTAESWTNTPTPDVEATIAAELTRLFSEEQTATATQWTPTPTLTPSLTPTATITPTRTHTLTPTRTPLPSATPTPADCRTTVTLQIDRIEVITPVEANSTSLIGGDEFYLQYGVAYVNSDLTLDFGSNDRYSYTWTADLYQGNVITNFPPITRVIACTQFPEVFIGLWETDTFFTTTYRKMGFLQRSGLEFFTDEEPSVFADNVTGNIMGYFNYRVEYTITQRLGAFTEQTGQNATQSPRIR